MHPEDPQGSDPPSDRKSAQKEEHLTEDEIVRYGRHLVMPEIGLAGQTRVKGASALIVGAGGLGSAAAFYLAATGIGKMGFVDFDVVELGNIQRQILHWTKDVGHSKLRSAAQKVSALNPRVRVVCHETKLTSRNALEIIEAYDIVLDASDNYSTRYLIHDSCFFLGKPSVYGAVFKFEGHASVFDSSRGPCYRCLYPEPPPPDLIPSCADAGVLGPMPGVIGSLQAIETVKLILGQGQPLIGRLLVFDALSMHVRELQVPKDPACGLCGPNPRIRDLVDYQAGR